MSWPDGGGGGILSALMRHRRPFGSGDMGAFEFDMGWYLDENGFIIRKPVPGEYDADDTACSAGREDVFSPSRPPAFPRDGERVMPF